MSFDPEEVGTRRRRGVPGPMPVSAMVKWALVGFITLVLLAILTVGGCREFNRYQKRANAKNEISVAEYNAKTVRAQIKATEARAEKRIVEARGIRTAQDLIAKTLTPLYVQHEAIQAQMHGGGGDRTYIPVGPQGVPLVADVNDPQLGEDDGR